MFGDEKSTTALREVLMFAIGNFAFPSVEHVNAKCGRQMENNFGREEYTLSKFERTPFELCTTSTI